MKLTTNPVSTQRCVITLIALLFITQVTSSPLPLPPPLPNLIPPHIHDSNALHQRDQDPPPSGFRRLSVPSSNQNRRPPPPAPDPPLPQVNYVPPGVKHVGGRPPPRDPPFRSTSSSFGYDRNERTRYASSRSNRDPLDDYSDAGRTSSSGSRYPSGPPPRRNTVNTARPVLDHDFEYGAGPIPSGSKRPSESDSHQAHSSTHPNAQDVPPPPPLDSSRFKGTATHFARPPIGPEEEQKLPGARRL